MTEIMEIFGSLSSSDLSLPILPSSQVASAPVWIVGFPFNVPFQILRYP